MKKIYFSLFLLNLLLILVFWWNISGVLLLSSPSFSAVFVIFGRIAGLVAVYFILLQFLIIGRVRWLEKVFGLDKLSVAHHWFGVSAILLIIAHLIFVLIGYAALNGRTLWRQFVDFNLHWENIFSATISFFLFGIVAASSVAIARKKLKYELWYYVHLLVYLAVLLAYGHQFELGYDLGADSLFAAYWVFLYIFVFTNFIFYRFIWQLWLFYRFRFYVSEIKQETNDTVSIYIKGRNIQNFRYQAGQFIIIRFLTRKFIKEAHPFTVSLEPNEDCLRITIKGLGDFSSAIKNVPIGTGVLVDGPNGVFTKKIKQGNKIIFVAGGVGITPFRALAAVLLKEKKDIVLLYSAREKENIIFKSELDKLAQENFDYFKIYYIIKGENMHGFDRIDDVCIKTLVPDIASREAFVCGPPAMSADIKRHLINLGINKHKVYYEKFSL